MSKKTEHQDFEIDETDFDFVFEPDEYTFDVDDILKCEISL